MSASNDLLRFALELAGIASAAAWGWTAGGEGARRFILAVAAPLLLIVVWSLLIAPRSDSPLSPTMRIVVGSGLLLLTAAGLYVTGRAAQLVFAFAGLIVANTALMIVSG